MEGGKHTSEPHSRLRYTEQVNTNPLPNLGKGGGSY